MVSFRELNIPVLLDTSAHDLTKDLFAPLLSRAARYDRGVGFITSLRAAPSPRFRFARAWM